MTDSGPVARLAEKLNKIPANFGVATRSFDSEMFDFV